MIKTALKLLTARLFLSDKMKLAALLVAEDEKRAKKKK